MGIVMYLFVSSWNSKTIMIRNLHRIRAEKQQNDRPVIQQHNALIL